MLPSCTEGGCKVSPSEVIGRAEPCSRSSQPSPSSAAAIGVIDPARTDADIEAVLRVSTEPGHPRRFEVAAFLPTDVSQANEALVDLRSWRPHGRSACSFDGTAVKVQAGRAMLEVGHGRS